MEKRRAVSLLFVGSVAILHLVEIGKQLGASWRVIYSSYFSDLVMPFAAYFLLCASEEKWPWCKPWQVKLALAILVPSLAETAQYLGIPVLGSTFDPLDYSMYVIGATVAAVAEVQIVTRYFVQR